MTEVQPDLLGIARPQVELICGDVIDVLKQMPEESVHTVITSPPYFGLRVYEGVPPVRWADGEMSTFGGESTLEGYLRHTVEVCQEIKRVLRSDGILWWNIADCYAGGGRHDERKEIYDIPIDSKPRRPKQKRRSGKDLLMVPERVALALQEDGWIIRQKIVWAKAVSFCRTFSGSVMPESTRDRPVWAYEMIYMLVKGDRYHYDIDGCREPYAESTLRSVRGGDYRGKGRKAYLAAGVQNPSDVKRRVLDAVASGVGRNLRNVWVIGKQNFSGSHFAVFPEKLVEPMIKLATSEKGACPDCGAQWKRVVQRADVPESVQEQFEASRAATADATGRSDGHTMRRPNHRREVIGTEWRAGCECGRTVEESVPAVVLDPFSGSGRTGLVARRLGRSYVGIDRSLSYIHMSAEAFGLKGANDDQRAKESTHNSAAGAEGVEGGRLVSR